MSLREIIERIRSLDEPSNEEATKLQIVLPILRELGWDAFDASRVVPEYSVGSGKSGGRVDLALMAPRRGPLALIEVKTAGARLDDGVDQVLGYAFKEGVDICVLTTGLKWWLYLPREKGPPVERRFAELDVESDSLEQLVDDFETYLDYEALNSGRAERHARQVLAARIDSERLSTELPRIWASLLNDPPQRLLDLIEQRVFNSTRLRPSHEQMAAFLVSRAATLGQPTEISPTPSVPSPAILVAPRKPKTRSTQPVAFVLFNERYEVRSWGDVLIGVAEQMYIQYGADFDRLLALRGSKLPLVSRYEEDLPHPKEIRRSGYWINTKHPSGQLVRWSHRILETFGHSPDELVLEFPDS